MTQRAKEIFPLFQEVSATALPAAVAAFRSVSFEPKIAELGLARRTREADDTRQAAIESR